MKRTSLAVALVIVINFWCAAGDKTSLTVRLTDDTGAAIVNAHVLVRNNSKLSAGADIAATPGPQEGVFSTDLAPGVYDILISAPCLVPFATQVKLTADRHEILSERMKLQGQVQPEYISSGCPSPDVIPSTPLVNPEPVRLPDRIPASTSPSSAVQPK